MTGTQPDPHEQTAEDQTHDERHQSGPDGVHEIDSKVPERAMPTR
jgi:hypothetical protein